MARQMVWVLGGECLMGSDYFYPEERPAHPVRVDGFWMDAHPGTNREFKQFAEATAYVTSRGAARRLQWPRTERGKAHDLTRGGRMIELLSHMSNLSVQLFAIASMAAVGIRYTVHEILGPLQNLRGVALALVANFVAVPLLAFLILRLLSLERGYAIGLLLVAAAAGAPFVIKLTKMSGGDIAFASGLLVLLLVVSIAYMPLVVPRLTADATVSAWAIAAPLVWTMLLPLLAGLWVDARWPRVASALWPALALLANVALVVLVVSTFLLHIRTVLGVFGNRAILASLLLLAGAFVIGWLFGGFGEHLDDEMAFGTAQRNFAAAMVVGAQSFADPEVLVMVVVVSLVSIAVLFPAAKLMGRHVARRSATPA